jgi:hypothetical protein
MVLAHFAGLSAALLLMACSPSDRHKSALIEKARIECLDKLCEGDVAPKFDSSKEFAFKVNGQWFIGPKSYGGYGASLAFFWPSKTPARGANAHKDAPEFFPSSAGVTSNFYKVGVEIFLRSNNVPGEPFGYKLVEQAQRNGWIASRNELRPGLQVIRMKHVIGPSGHYIDAVAYYIATGLKGADGLPPVATCSFDLSDGGAGTGFMWKPGIWAGARTNPKHCTDWPEIYLEISRVLQLFKKP